MADMGREPGAAPGEAPAVAQERVAGMVLEGVRAPGTTAEDSPAPVGAKEDGGIMTTHEYRVHGSSEAVVDRVLGLAEAGGE